MVRRPVWLAGIAADALGFVCQAIALSIGRLAIVQPLLVSASSSRFRSAPRSPASACDGRHRRRGPGHAALIAFLTIANPSGGRDDAPIDEWLIAGAVFAAVVAPLLLAASAGRRAAALLGIAAGILFALSAALTKAVCDQIADELFSIFTHWHLYALIAIGYISLTLSQLALSTGALAPAIATSMAFDPIASVILGVTLFDETIHETPSGWPRRWSPAAALAGVAILSRKQGAPPARNRSRARTAAAGRRRRLVAAPA